jgi:NADPH2:quinone reductase
VRAIRIHATGGPEALALDEIEPAAPGRGELVVQVAFAGVNFIDVYHRSGLYPAGPLPARLGKEGAGEVIAVGADVATHRPGDRVAFVDATGSYAEEVVLPAARALALPRGFALDRAAALPLQAMTADYLVRTIGRLGAGDTVLVHAAAGGVGRLAVQMAKRAGAVVFGTCSSAAKAELARAAGCDHPLRYDELDFAAEVLRLTAGRGVDLVLDSVGRATFVGSVRATRVRGTLVLFGQSSGTIEPFSPRAVLGSRTLVTATLFDYVRDPAELAERWTRVNDDLGSGRITLAIDSTFPLERAADAHRRLESRRSSGKILLAVG